MPRKIELGFESIFSEAAETQGPIGAVDQEPRAGCFDPAPPCVECYDPVPPPCVCFDPIPPPCVCFEP